MTEESKIQARLSSSSIREVGERDSRPKEHCEREEREEAGCSEGFPTWTRLPDWEFQYYMSRKGFHLLCSQTTESWMWDLSTPKQWSQVSGAQEYLGRLASIVSFSIERGTNVLYSGSSSFVFLSPSV